jgi:protein-disulfide isomerase
VIVLKVKAQKNNVFSFILFLTLVISLLNSWMIFDLKKNLGSRVTITNPTQTEENNPTQPQRLSISSDDDPVKGSKDAKVVIVEFSDFQCPFCARFFDQTLPLIERDYIKTGKVQLVYRDFPLSFHQYAQKAAEAAQCANEQGKFWEYHDLLFKNQNEWISAGEAKLLDYAKALELDTNKFNSCLTTGKYESEVKKDFQDGLQYGVQGTPTFFINGIPIVGAQPYEAFKQVIDQQLAG